MSNIHEYCLSSSHSSEADCSTPSDKDSSNPSDIDSKDSEYCPSSSSSSCNTHAPGTNSLKRSRIFFRFYDNYFGEIRPMS